MSTATSEPAPGLHAPKLLRLLEREVAFEARFTLLLFLFHAYIRYATLLISIIEKPIIFSRLTCHRLGGAGTIAAALLITWLRLRCHAPKLSGHSPDALSAASIHDISFDFA